MASSSITKLAIAELIIYILIYFLCLWLCIKQRLQKISNWLYIALVSIVHIGGSSYQIHSKVDIDNAIEILDAVSVAVILIALAGFLRHL